MMLIKVISLVMGFGFMLRAGTVRMKGFRVNLVNLLKKFLCFMAQRDEKSKIIIAFCVLKCEKFVGFYVSSPYVSINIVHGLIAIATHEVFADNAPALADIKKFSFSRT